MRHINFLLLGYLLFVFVFLSCTKTGSVTSKIQIVNISNAKRYIFDGRTEYFYLIKSYRRDSLESKATYNAYLCLNINKKDTVLIVDKPFENYYFSDLDNHKFFLIVERKSISNCPDSLYIKGYNQDEYNIPSFTVLCAKLKNVVG